MEPLLFLLLAGSLGIGYAVGKRRSREDVSRPPPPGQGRTSGRLGIDARRYEYNLVALRPRLEGHVRLVLQRLGAGIARHPPIRFQPPTDDDRMRYVKAAIRMAGRRFGTGSNGVLVRFADLKGPRQAGSIRITPSRSYIEISNDYKDLDDAVVLIAAHELAHHALHSKGVTTGDPAEDEELTDTLVVLAGFGPLMLDVYHQEFSGVVEDGIRLWVSGLGYLHPTAIAYLSLLQTEIAGLEPSETVDWGSPWYIEPWEERKDARAEAVSAGGGGRCCHICAEKLPAADPGTNGLSRCRSCEVVQPGPRSPEVGT